MKNLFLISVISFAIKSIAQSPEDVRICQTSEMADLFYGNNTKAQIQQANFETFIKEYSKQNQGLKKQNATCYIIPVVFHVYGTTQGGKTVNNSIIINALNGLNNDFHGLNSDYSTVHNTFLSIRDKMPDLTFALAQKDPSGNPTSGIVYHTTASGYGNGTGYDAIIAADAWDNYKYMNVYVMNDLYNDGVTNNSGVAWYPSTIMSDNNTARVVYNGAYLGTNTGVEFASVLTHEFGHWLNLIHTFEGGCVSPNDNVNDTPPCDYSAAHYTCHPSASANSPLNCSSNLINAENYMDYSGASGCYKMFTQGQVARMYASLMHPARQALWQPANLVATGLSSLCDAAGIRSVDYNEGSIQVYPNPSSDHITLNVNSKLIGSTYVISDQLGRTMITGKITSEETLLNISTLSKGVYILNIGNQSAYKKIIKN